MSTIPPSKPSKKPLITALVALLVVFAGCNEGDLLRPFGPEIAPPFKAAFFPVEVVPGALGAPVGAARGPDGDLLVAGYDTDQVLAVSRTDGSLRVVSMGVTGGTASVLSVAHRDGIVYAGSSAGKIYSIAAGGASSEIADLGAARSINGLAIAPARFTPHAGKLIAISAESATGPGHVEAIDLSDPSQIDLVYSDVNAAYVDLAMSFGGELYVVDYAGAQISRVDSTSSTPVATGFMKPVGITLDSWSGEAMVADAGDDTIYTVNLSTGSAAALGQFAIRSGALPSGLVFDDTRTLMIMTEGSSVARGVVVPGISPSALPTVVHGTDVGFGGIAFDGGGAIFGTANGSTNGVYRLSRSSGNGSWLGRGLGNPGEALLGMAYDPARTRLYIGTSDERIHFIDGVGRCILLADLSTAGYGAVSALALAPANFGAWGGSLIAVTDLGNIVSIDPDSGAASLVGGPHNVALSGVAFAADGTLFVANHTGGSIVTVAPVGGALTDFAVGLGEPDGLVLDQLGTTLYVADSQGDTLWAVSVPGGVATSLGAYSFDAGSEPTAITFDGLGMLVLGTGESSLTLVGHSVFP
jgi:DNA-binding beta-propeller fold protein YncE